MKKLLQLLIVVCLLVILEAPSLLPVHAPLSSPSVVTNPGTGQKLFKFAWERATVFAGGLYWSFWPNSGTCEGENLCLFYSTSPDAQIWSTPTNVGVHVNREDFSVTTDGSKIYYARYNETDYFVGTCSAALLFRQGSISGATISWQSENTVIGGNATSAFLNPNLKLDSNGQAWIGYLYSETGGCGGSGKERPRAIHSSGTNYASWSAQTTLTNAHSNNWAVDLTSLGNGAMYFTYWLDGSTASATDLHGQLFNTTFGADQQISSTSDKLDNNAFVFNNGPTVYAVWLDENLQRLMVASTTFTAPSTETWNSPTLISASECCSSLSGYSAQPWTASYDSVTNLLYLFWYNYTNNQIDLYQGLSSWTGPSMAWTTTQATSTTSVTSFQYSANAGSSGQVIGVQFIDGIGYNSLPLIALKYAADTVFAGSNGGGGPNPSNNPGPAAQQQNNFAFNSTSFRTSIGNVTLPFQLTRIEALALLAVFPVVVLASSENGLREIPVVLRLKRAKVNPLLTAAVTTGLDYVFHLSLTQPMEVPVYFVAKLIVAYLIARILVPRLGTLLSAAAFTLSFDVYYAIGVLLLHVPGLSSSPNQIIEVAGFGSSCLGYATCDLTTEGLLLLLWTVVHGTFFFVGTQVAKYGIHQPNDPIVLRATDASRRTSLI